ncbi:MAG TPA: TIM44-like domain-containing protein [Burkholderiaceae bacterium]|nr:TIM44-like domain-containing protein [Burkholderiaceae bacterium]
MKTRSWSTKYAVALLCAALLPLSSEAKRLGGGGSIGRQSSTMTQRQATPPPSAPTSSGTMQTAPAQATRPAPAAATPTPAQPARSRWLGPLAGVAAGLGLAALFHSLGFGAELASFLSSLLLIMLVVFAGVVIWRMLRRPSVPARPQPAYAGMRMGPNTIGGLGREGDVHPQPSAPLREEVTIIPAATAPSLPGTLSIPADFDVEGFVRNAKQYFVRLQAAWDAGRLDEIRDFTAPEMFGEIDRQWQERNGRGNQTDVVTLDAELLGVNAGAQEHQASVRFRGLLREDTQQAAQPFDEVWNLIKPAQGSGGWVLAGIEQVQTAH